MLGIIIQPKYKDISKVSSDLKLQEALLLCNTLNIEVALTKVYNIRDHINPSLYIGKGLAEEINNFIKNSTDTIDVVLINDNNLSSIQQRNLERLLNCKVIDRTLLILNIFAEHASTKEGRLQVELASLLYQKSRLVKAWSHLERQRGGGGFIGGPGETQKELDRRMISVKINKIKQQLKSVENTRNLQRKARSKSQSKIVSLVGYTNSGKSTLFNNLTSSNVMAADILFATLDPIMRVLVLPHSNIKQRIILSDTVGFISDLPHELVSAFKSTLEEVKNADLLLHIIDISSPKYLDEKVAVIKVLKDLGIEEGDYNKKCIEVYNKVDLLDEKEKEYFLHETNHEGINKILVSAKTGTNINLLLKMIADYFTLDR